ncbi:inactive transglutaminase family protein [Thiohalospira sp.]|uniref:inactive transglutaminase family protein n=1 Tax=Thiohalospira sp. TaxID=3080549 RepID=UPI003981024D
MAHRAPFFVVVALLLAAGLGGMAWRALELGVPLGPGEQRAIWEVEAQVRFTATGGPVRASLALPEQQAGFRRISEHTASSGYGLDRTGEGGRRALWTVREASGEQHLYYSVQLMEAPGAVDPPVEAVEPEPVLWEPPNEEAARDLVERARARSAGAASLARQLIAAFGDADGESQRLLETSYSRPELLVRLLADAEIGARVVHGLELADGRRRQSLEPWLEVYTEEGPVLFDPESGERGRPDDLLLWERGGEAVLAVEGGEDSRVHFSMLRHREPAARAVRSHLGGEGLLDLTIHALPLEEQALFKTLLLIPVGALVVVILRVLVGVSTSGTFMPVLIALAFMRMSLATGLIAFTLVVATGLLIRGWLSRLNLLLVARVSAVIITVIAIMAVFSVMAWELGLNQAMTITFFPIIILAWTIERMSVLWEEEGGHEVLVQGGGSLLTAVLAYLAMDNPWVRHLTFNFPELQLALLALILLLGSYTGYRLLELRRFRPMTED